MKVHEIFESLFKNIIAEIEYHAKLSDYYLSHAEYARSENEEQIALEIVFLWRDIMNYYAKRYDIKEKPELLLEVPYAHLYEQLIKIDEGASALRIKKFTQDISKFTSP